MLYSERTGLAFLKVLKIKSTNQYYLIKNISFFKQKFHKRQEAQITSQNCVHMFY